MSFRRNSAHSWQEEVAGARWFKADLHIHTIDDHPGGRAKVPDGLTGKPDSPETLVTYARRFLQALVKHGVQVAGLTPHSPRAGDGPETSAVWRIVEEWNEGTDSDGTPFRDKIYALFPGFEPSFNNGSEGLHILFLFDPEIGRERYMRAFDIVMGGIAPWRENNLRISGKHAKEAFRECREFWERESQGPGSSNAWNYIILAPHIETPKGLLGAQKAQVLQHFDHDEVAGLELGDDTLPEQALENRPWLSDGMLQYRQAFFHSSDAYRLRDIGRRHVWIKLAAPRIEALRQAFIARESRMRIGFERDSSGKLRAIESPPDASSDVRPWLREVTISGGASFFGGKHRSRFRLSPDLTCLIGGSMTGKSTFLDGLRAYTGASLPEPGPVRDQVMARGHLFAAGSAQVNLDCPGSDPTAPLRDRWPARFFAQNELQRLAQDETAVENILTKLVPSEAEKIEQRSGELDQLDKRLLEIAKELEKSDGRIAEGEQAHERARCAKEELARFEAAGVDHLHRVGREHQAWKNEYSLAAELRKQLEDVLTQFASAPDAPEIDQSVLHSTEIDVAEKGVKDRRVQIGKHIRAAIEETEEWVRHARNISDRLANDESDCRARVENTLGERGLGAARLREFQELNRQASLLPNYADALVKERSTRNVHQNNFDRAQEKRSALTNEQRNAFVQVAQTVDRDFNGVVRVRRIDSGNTRLLERFLTGLRQRGVTRWWNELSAGHRPSPEELEVRLERDSLDGVGMSGAVQESFREAMTRSRRRELAALRCPDLYVLEYQVDENEYRPLDELSGGRRVGVLLSLLLETTDNRPLVIDQPEDELDNRFLFDTVLPALRRLRGRRQVILATHNPNIVVNGDADMVIQLEAAADHGRVACAGAIEDPAVRNAIVRTVDGGEEAFRLRRHKYGF